MDSDQALSRVYTSFSGLDRLRQQARAETPEAAQETATQFEAMFIQMMLRSMRDAGISDDALMGDQERFYRDLFDQQIALHLAERRELGIADLLLDHIQPAASEGALLGQERNPFANQLAPQRFVGMPRGIATRPKDAPITSLRSRATNFATPEQFVRTVRPFAETAAEALGIDPSVLIAQSALETGWGAHMIQRTDGSNSNSFFGIKADGRWQGERVRVASLEFEDGIPVKRTSAFRSYATIEESFEDYVDFLQSHPRYQQAVESGGDAHRFISELQDAGYATDPHYARKVMDIMRRNLVAPEQVATLDL